MRAQHYLRQHQQSPGGQAGQAGRAVNIRGQALGEQISANKTGEGDNSGQTEDIRATSVH